jgi:tetratricopeptide (TPR) repeat protein
MSSTTIRVFRTLALLGALLVPITTAAAFQNEADEHMRQGMTLIRSGQAEEALAEFEKAIEASPELATAHYYAGMALGQLQRFEESLEHFMTAGELDPGNAQIYVMACRTAYSLQNYDEAWNQGILASQAGMDMSEAFAGLEQVSSRPDDFDARMSVPRVLVAPLDTSRVLAGDATPGSSTGSTMMLATRQEDLVETRRQLGLSLIRSERFSVTQSVEMATYVLLVEIDDIEAFSGQLKLIDPQTDATVVSRPVSFPTSIGSLRSETDRLVSFLEERLQNR